MREKRLFERIRDDWPKNSGQRNLSRPGDQIASVIDHLKKLLNSRQGTTLIDQRFGMPDITDLRATFPDSVRDIENSISRTIEYFEPRLKQVDVTFVEQDEQMTLYFQIRATLMSDDASHDIFLESTLDPSGRMAVRR